MEHNAIAQNGNCKKIEEIFPWPEKITANFERDFTSRYGTSKEEKQQFGKERHTFSKSEKQATDIVDHYITNLSN